MSNSPAGIKASFMPMELVAISPGLGSAAKTRQKEKGKRKKTEQANTKRMRKCSFLRSNGGLNTKARSHEALSGHPRISRQQMLFCKEQRTNLMAMPHSSTKHRFVPLCLRV
jgi:hypothetical protein